MIEYPLLIARFHISVRPDYAPGGFRRRRDWLWRTRRRAGLSMLYRLPAEAIKSESGKYELL